MLEGQVLNSSDFLKYGQMDMVSVQLGLVQVLQNAGGLNLNRQLTHHQTTLVSRLKQIGTNETVSDDKKWTISACIIVKLLVSTYNLLYVHAHEALSNIYSPCVPYIKKYERSLETEVSSSLLFFEYFQFHKGRFRDKVNRWANSLCDVYVYNLSVSALSVIKLVNKYISSH